MNLTPADLRALRRYYLRLWLANLAAAAFYAAGAQFWRGIYAALCGIAWLLARRDDLRARWSHRVKR